MVQQYMFDVNVRLNELKAGGRQTSDIVEVRQKIDEHLFFSNVEVSYLDLA